MATATKSTVPARTRAARKPATAKAAPATAATEPTITAEDEATDLQKVGPFELPALDPSKSYAKFDLSTDVDGNATGCVGTVYAPLGTTSVKVVYYGPEK